MSKGQTLRALVNERLTAAAEDIFALFERTIAEYEEELCRSKEENERKQKLLDSVLSPRVLLHRTDDVQNDSCSHDLSLNQEITATPQIKEEASMKQEEEQLPEFVAVCVKREEQFSPLQQRQTEHREETQGEDCGRAEADTSLDPHGHLHSETEEQTDNSSDTDNEGREPPASSSTQQMETEADGDDYNQVQIKDRRTAAQNSSLFTKYKSAPETSDTVQDGDISGTNVGDEGKKHKCFVCNKRFKTKHKLVHTRVHTSEKPYSCPVCKKEFALSSFLTIHMNNHNDKPFSCSICKKTFACKPSLKLHVRTHTGEKPYSCSVCKKNFTQMGNLKQHMRTHTGEKPYSCSVCKKMFSQKCALKHHIITHTGEKPYSCSVCKKNFTQMSNLKQHMRTHTGEKPFSCSVCEKMFSQKCHLKKHENSHRRGTATVQSSQVMINTNLYLQATCM